MWIKKDEVCGKKPEFRLGKMPVFPARKLQTAQSPNREMRQLTYLQKYCGQMLLFTAGLQL